MTCLIAAIVAVALVGLLAVALAMEDWLCPEEGEFHGEGDR